MPDDSSSGYTLVTDPSGGRNGSVYTFMQKVAVVSSHWQCTLSLDMAKSRFHCSILTCFTLRNRTRGSAGLRGQSHLQAEHASTRPHSPRACMTSP